MPPAKDRAISALYGSCKNHGEKSVALAKLKAPGFQFWLRPSELARIRSKVHSSSLLGG